VGIRLGEGCRASLPARPEAFAALRYLQLDRTLPSRDVGLGADGVLDGSCRASSSRHATARGCRWRVFTITYVGEMLDEDEDWLHELSTDLFPEDGRLHVYRGKDDAITAFTEDGIENLKQIIADMRPRSFNRVSIPRRRAGGIAGFSGTSAVFAVLEISVYSVYKACPSRGDPRCG
jgi:hypothetical protein